MKNTTHRVVILNNVNSKLISQAILILKDNAGSADTNVMLEAERIVESYMKQNSILPPKKTQSRLAGILSAGVILAALAIFLIARII